MRAIRHASLQQLFVKVLKRKLFKQQQSRCRWSHLAQSQIAALERQSQRCDAASSTRHTQPTNLDLIYAACSLGRSGVFQTEAEEAASSRTKTPDFGVAGPEPVC